MPAGAATTRMFRHPLTWVTALFVLLSWIVAFGGHTDLVSRGYGGAYDWDAGSAIWYLDHLRRAVFGQGRLFFSDRIFYPQGLHLVGQDWVPVVGVLALPFAAGGPLLAHNLQIPLGYALTALATVLLCRRLGASWTWAALAGLGFGFCEMHLLKAQVQGQPAHAHQQFMPLYLLFLFDFFFRGGRRRAVAAGLCLFLATFVSPYQGAFLALITALWLLSRIGRELGRRLRGQRSRPRVVPFVLWGGLAAVLPTVAVLWTNRDFVGRALALMHRDAEATGGTDLLYYFSSTHRLAPAAGVWLDEYRVTYLGLALLVLAVGGSLAVVRRHRPDPRPVTDPEGNTPGVGPSLSWLWTCAVLFGLLSLGGSLVWRGERLLDLPFFGWLQQLPLMSAVRFAPRYASVTVLCLAIIAALSWTRLESLPWLRRPPVRRAVRLLALCLVFVDLLGPRLTAHLLGQTAGHPLPAAEVNRIIAADPDDVAVLSYPPVREARAQAVGDGVFPASLLLAYQAQHGKRMLGGFADYIADESLTDFRHLPLVADLVAVRRGTPPRTSPRALAEARALVRRLNLRYIVIHNRPPPGMPPWPYHPDRARAYLDKIVRSRPVHQTQDHTLLRVNE